MSSSTTDIIHLNVGGQTFATSRATLMTIPDSFFSSLLSGRIPSFKDENGAIFIDRDPKLFEVVLQYLRTKEVDLSAPVDVKILMHEAEYYGLNSLVKRLMICDDLNQSSCGDLLFHGYIEAPVLPTILCNNLPTQGPDLDPSGCANASISWHGSIEAPSGPHRRCLSAMQPTSKPSSVEVTLLAAHRNYVAAAYGYFTICYKLDGEHGWSLQWTGPMYESPIDNLALTAILPTTGSNRESIPILALASGSQIEMWSLSSQRQIDTLCGIGVDDLFFLGRHLGTFSLHVCYREPTGQPITAISVYMTPKTPMSRLSGKFMEIAYGTNTGTVRIVVQHPELERPLYQTFTVHRSPITRIALSENHLISVCADNHVRTWTVNRFRGTISTQPGALPLACFKILSLQTDTLQIPVDNIGPFRGGEHQLFVQKVVSESDQLFVRFAATGQRVCKITSVDQSSISTFKVHECDTMVWSGRIYLLTGHRNGSIQMWDLTTALDEVGKTKGKPYPENVHPSERDGKFHEKKFRRLTDGFCNDPNGGPNSSELLQLLQEYDLRSSGSTTPIMSPSASLLSRLNLATQGSARNSVHYEGHAPLIRRSRSNMELRCRGNES